MLLTLAISGYRSLRSVVMPLDRLNIVTGPNGSGKSSLYKAIRLLADVAQGRIIGSLAIEGGLRSTLWAGPERFSRAMKSGEAPVQATVRNDRVSLKLGFADEDYGYAIDLGLPQPSSSAFGSDPEIKTEAVWAGEMLRRSNVFATRGGPAVTILGETSERRLVMTDLAPFDSMMTYAADPKSAPELLGLRQRMRSWRFYDHSAPIRTRRPGKRRSERGPPCWPMTERTLPPRCKPYARSATTAPSTGRWTTPFQAARSASPITMGASR